MKRLIIIGLLASGAWATTDFSQMSTEQLMNMRGSVPVDDRPAFHQEMQKRMQSMSPEEGQKYMQGNKCQGMDMGKNRMMNMPTFTEFDLNKDGKMSESEFKEAHAKRMNKLTKEGRMLKNADKAPVFKDIDTNKDGTVTPEEFQIHQTEKMENNCMSMGMGKNRMMNMPTFTEFDLNKDGKMSESEFKEAHAKRMDQRAKEGKMLKNADKAPTFADIDTNKDGTVTPEEFQIHQTEQMQNNCMSKCMGADKNK